MIYFGTLTSDDLSAVKFLNSEVSVCRRVELSLALHFRGPSPNLQPKFWIYTHFQAFIKIPRLYVAPCVQKKSLG